MPLKRYLVVAGLLFGACIGTTEPYGDLSNARAKWMIGRPQSYDITVQRICFCGIEIPSPVRVSVRNGEIASRVYVSSGVAVSAEHAQFFPDVEGLFLIVDEALTGEVWHLDVGYDPALGVPLHITIDRNEMWADDELDLTVSNFVVKS